MLEFVAALPLVIQIACGVLVVMFASFMVNMLRECSATIRQCEEFRALLAELPPQASADRGAGMPLAALEQMRSRAAGWKTAKEWWGALESALEPYAPPARPEGWFLTRPISEVLQPSNVVERGYHASFHQAVPSLLTGFGLMATFIAILVALQGVTVEVRAGAEMVQGIGTLINGLAAKFVSSILALALSLLFILTEKKWCERRLDVAYSRLISQAETVLPMLHPTRVLLDLQRESARRNALLEGFYANLVERSVAAVKTELAPSFAEGVARQVSNRMSTDITESVAESVAERVAQRVGSELRAQNGHAAEAAVPVAWAAEPPVFTDSMEPVIPGPGAELEQPGDAVAPGEPTAEEQVP